MYINGIHCDLMPKICLCLMPKWHMFDKTLSEENQREWHREGKAIFMGSLFKYLNSQGLFESYLTFTRLDFTCIRCIAVSEEIIPNKVNHGGSPTIYFALPPFLNSSSKWGGVGQLGWWLTAGVPISTCKSSLTPVHKCLCWMLVNMWLLIRKQLIRHQFSLFQRNCLMFACDLVADCPAVSLDLYIYTNKYPNVKQLSWAINQAWVRWPECPLQPQPKLELSACRAAIKETQPA